MPRPATINQEEQLLQYQQYLIVLSADTTNRLGCMQGVALAADPNYKVLGAAYPWIARRLLTEQSPELRDTLRSLLYKKGRFQVLRQMHAA